MAVNQTEPHPKFAINLDNPHHGESETLELEHEQYLFFVQCCVVFGSLLMVMTVVYFLLKIKKVI